MAFVTPKQSTMIARKSKVLSRWLEETMVTESIVNFRTVVLENEVGNAANKSQT